MTGAVGTGLCPEAPGGQRRGREEPPGAFPCCPWAAAPLPAALTHPCVPQALPRAYSIIAPVLPPRQEANLMPNASRSSPKCDCFRGRGPKLPVICSPDNGNALGTEQRAAPCAWSHNSRELQRDSPHRARPFQGCKLMAGSCQARLSSPCIRALMAFYVSPKSMHLEQKTSLRGQSNMYYRLLNYSV